MDTMDLRALRSSLGDYAKDTKLNIGAVLSEEGAPDLSNHQIYQIALASSYATQNDRIVAAIEQESKELLSDQEIQAAKAATTIMAMNNVYYRFLHLIEDKRFSRLPAKLRMNVIGQPGVSKIDFELMCLAVSAINGCGMCIDAHVKELQKAGTSDLGIQSCIRISSVMQSFAQALFIQDAS
jgi:alkyl hydroperoxide reductase subunit D